MCVCVCVCVCLCLCVHLCACVCVHSCVCVSVCGTSMPGCLKKYLVMMWYVPPEHTGRCVHAPFAWHVIEVMLSLLV